MATTTAERGDLEAVEQTSSTTTELASETLLIQSCCYLTQSTFVLRHHGDSCASTQTSAEVLLLRWSGWGGAATGVLLQFW